MNIETNNIVPVDIEREMKKSYMAYSMSVIVGRALPDVRDGLKPVHRRILYTMHENGLGPTSSYRKCADTVGSVLGRYHPHGDASVYDALVRMAQDFSLRYMLVDGHGNFGSVDGDPPAAYRYTEAKMSKISMEMLTDIEKDTVDFTSNYDDRLKEPSVLPSKFPNLLVNGSTGIAVGMATNIPPHNLREVIDGVIHLIDNPEAELDELMEYIKGPDFPTGAIIMGRSGIRSAYATGRGRIVVRARTEIEETNNSRFKILVTELPYQVNKARLIENIAELVKDKRIEGISNIEDHSDREGMRIVIDLKRDSNPQLVLNQLYTFTQMQSTFGVIMLALSKGEPKVLTLKEVLKSYLDFQVDIIRRRTIFNLNKAKERAHILEGLKIALDNIDEVIEILRSSKSIPEGKTRLIERFELDDIQAGAIVAMRFGQLTGLERSKIEDELEELRLKIIDLLDILNNDDRKFTIVKEEITAIRTKFGDERRTEIMAVSGEVDIEDLIAVEDCVLTLTNFGYMKRLPADTYKAQRRGGRGVSGMTRREEDYAEEMFICSTHDYVMFFSNLGKVYRLKCYEIPVGSRTSKGINAANILPIVPDEKITAMIKVSEFEEDSYLCMVTKHGVIKRASLKLYDSARKGGLIAINLDEGDELKWVRKTNGYDELLVATKKGAAIHFDENNVRAAGRTARGVKALNLVPGDEVIGMARIRENATVLTVTETGYGRRSKISDYRLQSRGGKGLMNYKTKLYGDVAAIKMVDEDDDIIMISSDGIVIRIPVAEISIFARPSKGVRVMRVAADGSNKVVSLARAPHDEDEIDDVDIEIDNDSEDNTEVTEVVETSETENVIEVSEEETTDNE